MEGQPAKGQETVEQRRNWPAGCMEFTSRYHTARGTWAVLGQGAGLVAFTSIGLFLLTQHSAVVSAARPCCSFPSGGSSPPG